MKLKMIKNLFEIPVFIGDIDVDKIKLKKINFEKTWLSKTNSTYKNTKDEDILNVIEKDSVIYLLNILAKLLEEKIEERFEISLLNIWENVYSDNDFQEPHIHAKSDYSFIIYKEVEKDGGKTVFLNPNRNVMESFTNIHHHFQNIFKPSCNKGQVIIFPSFLEHMVLKTSNQHTISGNLKFDTIKMSGE